MPATESQLSSSIFDGFVATDMHPAHELFPWRESELTERLVNFRRSTQPPLTQEQVGRQLEWSTAKVQRIENGKVTPSLADTLALLEIYDVRDETVRDEVLTITRGLKRARNKHAYREYLPDTQTYLGCEAGASRISIYEAEFVPDILQSDACAKLLNDRMKSLLDSTDNDIVVAKQLRTERRGRAAYVLGHGPALRFIFDQAAFERADAEGQLETFIADLNTLCAPTDDSQAPGGRNTQVSVYIASFDAGLVPAIKDSCTIFESSGAQPIAFALSIFGCKKIRSQATTTRYLNQFNRAAQKLSAAPPELLATIPQQVRNNRALRLENP